VTRNQHERDGLFHFGTMPADVVETAFQIGGLPAGATLQEAVEWLYAHVTELEWGRHRGAIFAVQSVLHKQRVLSFPLAAYLLKNEFFINCTISSTFAVQFSADAALIAPTEFEARAILYALGGTSFDMAAWLERAFYVDALISTPTQARIAQFAVETVVRSSSLSSRVAQIAVETMVESDSAAARVAQIAVEVLVDAP